MGALDRTAGSGEAWWRVVVGLLGIVLVAGCTGSPAGSSSPTPTPAPVRSPSRAAVDVPALDLGAQEAADWPWLETGLPRRVPASVRDLPPLTSDPPGRALLAYHPSESGDGAPWGWGTEEVAVLGADRRWRRLDFAGLGLDEGSVYRDVYGAGELSPDGRWWLGKAGDGIVLVDLAEATAEVVQHQGWSAQLGWLPDGSAFWVGRARPGVVDTVDLRTRARTSYRRDAGRMRLAGDRRSVEVTGRGREYAIEVGDPARPEEHAVLRLDNRDWTIVQVEQWLDEDILLLTGRDGLLAWRTGARSLQRVVGVPRPEAANWDLAVAVELVGDPAP